MKVCVNLCSNRDGERRGDRDREPPNRGGSRWEALEEDRREEKRGGGGGGRWGGGGGGGGSGSGSGSGRYGRGGEERADGRWNRMRDDDSADWSKPLPRNERLEQYVCLVFHY
jgi:hypothetical protein